MWSSEPRVSELCQLTELSLPCSSFLVPSCHRTSAQAVFSNWNTTEVNTEVNMEEWPKTQVTVRDQKESGKTRIDGVSFGRQIKECAELEESRGKKERKLTFMRFCLERE